MGYNSFNRVGIAKALFSKLDKMTRANCSVFSSVDWIIRGCQGYKIIKKR